MPRLTSTEGRRYLLQRLLLPPLAALSEDGLEVAIEEGAGVLEVLFGVGFGGGEALKRFVQQADDPLLFGQRGDGNGNLTQTALVELRNGQPRNELGKVGMVEVVGEPVIENHGAMWPQHMSVVVDPNLSFNGEGGILA